MAKREFKGLDLQTTFDGLEDLQDRLQDPEMLGAAMKVLGSRIARAGKATAVKAITGGTGMAAQTVFASSRPLQGEVSVWSVMKMATALQIEEGRAPGNPPGFWTLQSWMHTVGHPGNVREVRAEITARGTKGKLFLAQTLEMWDDSLPRWIEEAARRIEKRWAKREAAGE